MLERNHQVALMCRVYSKATKVIAWLGPGSPETMFALRELSRLPTSAHAWPEDGREDKHLIEFCTKAYWGRAWVTQEFVLAKELEIWCGTEVMEYDVLQQRASNTYNVILGLKLPFLEHQAKRLYKMCTTREAWHIKKFDMDLHRLLSELEMEFSQC